MPKKYKYNNKEFNSTWELRKQIWANEKIIYGQLITQEQFTEAGLNVVVEEYTIETVLTEEEKAQRIRDKRDRLITQSDFYMMADYPSTEQGLALVKTYRQALRDITTQNTFPQSVSWPDVPVVLLKEPQKTRNEVLNLKTIDI